VALFKSEKLAVDFKEKHLQNHGGVVEVLVR
jgi:hypothetical protein